VREVFYAVADPNPKMSGGAMTLEKAGITVHTSLLENPAREVNRLWLEAQRLGRPYVIAKAAMSLDGRIALLSGESKWITDERARSAGHRLRAECGCVLVGRNTVSIDDPELTARIPGVQNPPLRVVVDRDATLQGSERMFNEAAPSLRLTSRPSLAQDIELVDFSCRSILGLLWTRGVTSVLIEGGAKTTTSFLKAGLVDRLELFVAPKALGNGPSWFEGHLESISLAPEFHFDRVRKVGPDLQITAYPVRSETSL
jgi:diaminohydroxyphosphoribosylaminopyrimidine deaminase/5-amino-6-(5-phosphoribosylamino)uracil reductase